MTDANRHETSTKYNIPELDGQNQGKRVVHVMKSELSGIVEPERFVAELPSKQDDLTASLASPEHGDTHQATQGIEMPTATSSATPHRTSGWVPPALASNESIEISPRASPSQEKRDEGKLGILRDRIDKIRQEKEILERIQELKDLEKQTKREILEEQRKRTGG